MTTKADYTAEEWVGIARAPVLAGAYIAVSDMSMFGLVGEMKGLYAAITSHPVPDAAADLVGAVVAEIRASDESKDSLPMPETKNSATAAAQLLHQLELDLEVLDRKAPREEAVAFKQWVADMAQATAEAGKEGGILGIGAVRVSDKEETALGALRRSLGLF
jgi:hypothetical protein